MFIIHFNDALTNKLLTLVKQRYSCISAMDFFQRIFTFKIHVIQSIVVITRLHYFILAIHYLILPWHRLAVSGSVAGLSQEFK